MLSAIFRHIRKARTGELSFSPYFSEASTADPLVLPINSSDVLAKFPPVETELHIWDGMWHAFFIDPDLPESNEVYRVIVKFFDRHLGRR